MNSWRQSTKQQYSSHMTKWLEFLNQRSIQLEQGDTVPVVLDFLSELYDKGLSYSTINSARSFLSSILPRTNNVSIGADPVISRFMRGVFNTRPNLPRYTRSWDVKKVLSYIQQMGDNSSLSLADLTHKLVMLIALVTGQRIQTLSLLDINHMHVYSDRIEFYISELVKQSRPSYHVKPIILHLFDNDVSLCVVRTLQAYLKVTKLLRTQNNMSKLLLTTQKPNKCASKDTIARWLKTILAKSGIDTSEFSAHSIRSTSTSVAKAAGVPIDIIMSKAGWSNESTFGKFYHKHIDDTDVSYSSAVLSSALCQRKDQND